MEELDPRQQKMDCARAYAQCMQGCNRQWDPCPCMKQCAEILQKCGKGGDGGPIAVVGPTVEPDPAALEAVDNLLNMWEAAPDDDRRMEYAEVIGQTVRLLNRTGWIREEPRIDLVPPVDRSESSEE